MSFIVRFISCKIINMQELELLITFGLVVLIWIIQILHYPSFYFVSKDRFIEFEKYHTQRISIIVIPLMLSEVVFLAMSFTWTKFVLLSFIWLSTFFIQVPCHQKLTEGFDLKTVQRLIKTNWIRTLLWSLKFVIQWFSL